MRGLASLSLLSLVKGKQISSKYMDLISICKYMCIFYVRGKVHRQTIFREGNEGKSTMVDLSVF